MAHPLVNTLNLLYKSALEQVDELSSRTNHSHRELAAAIFMCAQKKPGIGEAKQIHPVEGNDAQFITLTGPTTSTGPTTGIITGMTTGTVMTPGIPSLEEDGNKRPRRRTGLRRLPVKWSDSQEQALVDVMCETKMYEKSKHDWTYLQKRNPILQGFTPRQVQNKWRTLSSDVYRKLQLASTKSYGIKAHRRYGSNVLDLSRFGSASPSPSTLETIAEGVAKQIVSEIMSGVKSEHV